METQRRSENSSEILQPYGYQLIMQTIDKDAILAYHFKRSTMRRQAIEIKARNNALPTPVNRTGNSLEYIPRTLTADMLDINQLMGEMTPPLEGIAHRRLAHLSRDLDLHLMGLEHLDRAIEQAEGLEGPTRQQG